MGNSCVHEMGNGGSAGARGHKAAAAAAAAVVEYPSGRHEFVAGGRVTAHQLMLKNPGFYVAKKSPSPSSTPCSSRRTGPARSRAAGPSLLPADALLCTGSHYRLLTFEEVFYQFARGNGVGLIFSPRLRSARKMQEQPLSIIPTPTSAHSLGEKGSIRYPSIKIDKKGGMESIKPAKFSAPFLELPLLLRLGHCV